MTNESATSGMPPAVDRATFQAELAKLRAREKAHTREGDAIAAARRRLPMVEIDATTPLTGPDGPVTLDAFEGRRQLIAYYVMWHDCPTCTPATSPTRSSARGPGKKASATTTSWAGTCPGTRPRIPGTLCCPRPAYPA